MSKIFKHIPLSYIDGKSLAPSYYKRFMINYNNNTCHTLVSQANLFHVKFTSLFDFS